MENLVEIKYAQTGQSSTTNELGMREMQAMVYEQRHRQYLLVKAPPASGKSRAMMFVALDKLAHQDIRKVIVAVPEQSIGRSFNNTPLSKFGFFADWQVTPYYNLCNSLGTETSKRKVLSEFLLPDTTAQILVCTHATLRNAMKDIPNEQLNDVFLGIDEFHHTSGSATNNLGELVRRLLNETSAHILAMTGSYFRGDAVPVMRPEDEAKFQPSINYNYYQQLSGYTYLKSLGIGYQFFTGKYISAIPEALDTTKKTLIHIPSVNAKTAYAHKYDEVADIVRYIGEVVEIDYEHYIYHVQTLDGRILKVGDLVEDNKSRRDALQAYLQRMNSRDALDILIALGTAKEGFDWAWCECCITIGIRSSLTEIVQIIGRCTRDCEGKTHAQFINLIPCPDAAQDDVSMAVNDFLKAISASLLMEQVMTPRWNFKTKRDEDEIDRVKEKEEKHTISVEGLPVPTERAQYIIDNDIDTLIASTLSDNKIREAIIGTETAEIITQVFIPKVIKEKYPELTEEETDQVAKHAILAIATQGEEITTDDSGNRFIRLANKFININDLSINLIDSINPFQRAYEILSKSLTPEVLRTIQYEIESNREEMTKEEAILLFTKYLPKWREEHNGSVPTMNEADANGRRIAMAIEYLRKLKQQSLSK
ncbi:DEAD/DEAH box helicase [Parabacteroides goldsteinii]|uniref:DEAD/DEAH box helicase n=1 Tax=Parabacteroides goldsteinii TaxID=328812 RepID=UPI00259AEAAB|nr:DEAD/DEAH box helicase [Parabacteroides goldsteinii]